MAQLLQSYLNVNSYFPNPAKLLAYIVVICVAFHPKTDSGEKVWHLTVRIIVQIIVCWFLVHAAGILYYAIFADNYLTQFQYAFFTLIYMLSAHQYSPSVRIITGFILWTSHMLLMSVTGDLIMPATHWQMWGARPFYQELLYGDHIFYIPMILAVVFYIRHYIVQDYILARHYSVAIIAVVTVTGALSNSNWGFSEGMDLHNGLMSIALLVFILMLYTLLNIINREYTQNLELLSMQSKAGIDQNNYQISHQYYEEMSMMRHELRNRNAYIKMLVKEKKYDQLEQYVTNESGQEALTRVADYGNSVVNSVLNWESTTGAADHISFDFKISLPQQLSISDLDLFTILKNILDNAREACQEIPIEQRRVSLRMYLHGQYLMIHMENPVSAERVKGNVLSLQTTKSNKNLHGYGTKIIRLIADRYHGEIKYEVKDGIFVTGIMLLMADSED